MRQVSKILLNRYLQQFKEEEQQKAAEQTFKGAWRSAEPVLSAMEVELELLLNKLIKEDEDIKMTEYNNPDKRQWHTKGQRKMIRRFLESFLRNSELQLGD